MYKESISRMSLRIDIYFLIYLFLFYLGWFFKEYWIGYIESFSNSVSILLSASSKIVIWIFPAWIYINLHLKKEFKSYIKLNQNLKDGIKWGGLLSLILGMVFLLKTFLNEEYTLNVPGSIGIYINGIFLVGLAEEIVYRGLILNYLTENNNFWKSNVLTSILFLIIHYPTWLNTKEFLVLNNHIYIVLFSLSLGYIYKRTNSLWSVIILHSFHNLFIIFYEF